MFASKLKCIWKCIAHRRQRWSFRVSLNISCETAWAASWLVCFRSKSLSNFPIANFHRDIRRNFLAVSNLQSPGSVEAKTSTFDQRETKTLQECETAWLDEKLPWHHNIKLSFWVFLSRDHSDQMSEESQVSKITICVHVLKWRSVSHSLRANIEPKTAD